MIRQSKIKLNYSNETTYLEFEKPKSSTISSSSYSLGTLESYNRVLSKQNKLWIIMASAKQISTHQVSTSFIENLEETEDQTQSIFSCLVWFLFRVHPRKWAMEALLNYSPVKQRKSYRIFCSLCHFKRCPKYH